MDNVSLGLGMGAQGPEKLELQYVFSKSFLATSALLLQDSTGMASPWSVPDPPGTGEGLDGSFTWVPFSTPHPAHTKPDSCGLWKAGPRLSWPHPQVLCLPRPPSRTGMT